MNDSDKCASRLAGCVVVLVVHASTVLLYQLSHKHEGKAAEVAFLQVFEVPPVTPVKPVDKPRRPAAALPRAARPFATPLPATEPLQQAEAPAAAAADPFAGSAADLGSTSRALARQHDREERKGKVAPLSVSNIPYSRMKAAIEGAHVGGAAAYSSYTSRDGVVVTRITRGGQSTCLIGGSPSGAARRVNCPPAGED